MRNKGQISTLGLVIGLVVLIVVALALIMVVTGRIGGVGTSVGEQEEDVFDKISEWIKGTEIPTTGEGTITTTTPTTTTKDCSCHTNAAGNEYVWKSGLGKCKDPESMLTANAC